MIGMPGLLGHQSIPTKAHCRLMRVPLVLHGNNNKINSRCSSRSYMRKIATSTVWLPKRSSSNSSSNYSRLGVMAKVR
jgi:hypothetical protein